MYTVSATATVIMKQLCVVDGREHLCRLNLNIVGRVSSVAKHFVVVVTGHLVLCSSPSRALHSSVVLLP